MCETIPVGSGQGKILVHFLASFSQATSRRGLSMSSFTRAKAAVQHYLSAQNPTPAALLSATSRAYARAHPPRPKHNSAPDLHVVLDHVLRLHKNPSEANDGLRLAMLMVVLGTRRASDATRIWRHRRCLRLEVHRLDLPSWASAHRFVDIDAFHKLGMLKSTTSELNDNEHVVLKFRAHLGKAALSKNLRYGAWVSLTENRASPGLCPVKALVDCSSHNYSAPIEQRLRCGKSDTITEITDDRGLHPIKARPLLVSLSGRPRTGLQSNTLNGLIRRQVFEPNNWSKTFSPHVLRGMSTSCKLAHGMPKGIVQATGDWASESSMQQCYVFPPMTPISPRRARDISLHDLVLSRAHQLSKAKSPAKPAAVHNDEAIAAALAI